MSFIPFNLKSLCSTNDVCMFVLFKPTSSKLKYSFFLPIARCYIHSPLPIKLYPMFYQGTCWPMWLPMLPITIHRTFEPLLTTLSLQHQLFYAKCLFCAKCETQILSFEISKNHKKTHLMLLGCYWEKLWCCNVCSTSSMLM